MRDDRGKLSRYRDTVKFALCIPSKGLSFIFLSLFLFYAIRKLTPQTKQLAGFFRKQSFFFLVVEEGFCNVGYHALSSYFERKYDDKTW